MRIIQTGENVQHPVKKSVRSEHQLVPHLQSPIRGIDGKLFPQETDYTLIAQIYGLDLSANPLCQVHYLTHQTCHYLDLGTGWGDDFDAYSDTSLMMKALHTAFADHIPFSLSPDAIWYCIAHEIAVHINLNQDRYRGYFTTSDKKEAFEVRDDRLIYGGPPEQWARSIPLIREPIQAKVPQATVELFLPKFTTSTENSELAILILFLNILINYYDINWSSLCGIPAVRLEGEASDWKTIVNHAELASREFTGLHRYFADLLPVLREIAGVAAGDEPDPVFWCSIYKYMSRSGGSGINGWITALIAHQKDKVGKFLLRRRFDWRALAEGHDTTLESSLDANSLPGHISTVPFKWHHLENTYNMMFVSGFMSMEYDGFLNPRLGYGVLERL